MIAIIIIFLGALVCLFASIKKTENFAMPIAITSIGIALVTTIMQLAAKAPWALEEKLQSGGMLIFDYSAQLFSSILMLGTIIILLGFKSSKNLGADLLGLILFSLCGGLILTGFVHLVMMFLGIEILSIPLYVLAGANKQAKDSNEAAIKYFLMGAFSTAILLMGCAFMYGGSGTLYIAEIAKTTYMQGHLGVSTPLIFGGVILILIGFVFKVAGVPFHFWSPDVYEGSPTRATVFMASVVKVAAFAGFIRLFAIAFGELQAHSWGNIVAIISALSILVGNSAATIQTNAKRLLAYSGIAQAGYMLIAFINSNSGTALWNLLTYSAAYVFASIIIFIIIGVLNQNGKDSSLESFRGIATNNKFISFAIVIAMLSMAGVPMTLGFVGKYNILTSGFAVKPWLVIVALIGSAIGIGVYFKFFKNAFLDAVAEPMEKLSISISQKIALGISIFGILFFGILPIFISNLKDFFVN